VGAIRYAVGAIDGMPQKRAGRSQLLQVRAIAPKLLAELTQLLLEGEPVEDRLDDIGRQ
jgi:hypothetical protein